MGKSKSCCMKSANTFRHTLDKTTHNPRIAERETEMIGRS